MNLDQIISNLERLLEKARQFKEYGSIRDSGKQEILRDLFEKFLPEITPSLLIDLVGTSITDARTRYIMATRLLNKP